MANITSRNKIEEMGIDQSNVIFKPVTLTKLKNILTKNENITPQLTEESLPVHTIKFDAKVLVTEDNIINQKLIKHILEKYGLSVDLANNGLECFEKYRNLSYDLVFMDIQMPVMDGIEATHEILEYEKDENIPHVPIIALTANALKGDREKFIDEGMDEYIAKPIELGELLYVLNKFLSERESTVFVKEKNEFHEESKEFKEEPAIEADLVKDEPILFEDDDKVEILFDEPEIDTSTVKKILIAKKFLLESRILTKVIDNLGYDYVTLENIDLLENELSSGAYDILFSDADLITENIRHANDHLAIVTSESSKEEIKDLIEKYRG
jgi:CheY-like chemotaxis protein